MNKKGFTLVEMLAVIVILSILATFTVISLSSSFKKQKQENYENEISSILSGARNYFSDNLGTNSVEVNTLIPKYVDISSDTIDVIGNPTVAKTACSDNPVKTKIEISVPSKIDGTGRSNTYNDCGCEEQPETEVDAKKLCE